jgi:hypothetical protein
LHIGLLNCTLAYIQKFSPPTPSNFGGRDISLPDCVSFRIRSAISVRSIGLCRFDGHHSKESSPYLGRKPRPLPSPHPLASYRQWTDFRILAGSTVGRRFQLDEVLAVSGQLLCNFHRSSRRVSGLRSPNCIPGIDIPRQRYKDVVQTPPPCLRPLLATYPRVSHLDSDHAECGGVLYQISTTTFTFRFSRLRSC